MSVRDSDRYSDDIGVFPLYSDDEFSVSERGRRKSTKSLFASASSSRSPSPAGSRSSSRSPSSSVSRPFSTKTLSGRNVIAEDPNSIIPIEWITGLCCGVVITLGLVITTILAAKGVFPLTSHQWSIMYGVIGTLETTQLITAVGLFFYYRAEKKEHDEAVKNQMRQDELDAQVITRTKGKETASTSMSDVEESDSEDYPDLSGIDAKDKTETIDDKQWAANLQAQKKTDFAGVAHYNMIDPNAPCDPHLPKFGKFANGRGATSPILMSVKLPKNQLKAFPDDLQTWFEKEKDVEYYFVVVDDTNSKGTQREISLDLKGLGAVYDSKSPNSPKGKPKNVTTTADGIRTSMQIAMFDPQGVSEGKVEGKRIPPEGNGAEHKLELHGNKNMPPLMSSTVPSIEIDKTEEISSVCIGAKIGEKAIAIQYIIVNDNTSAEAAQIVAATKKDNLVEFLAELRTLKNKHTNRISRTFTHSSELR